jgi:hypothetical protein
VPLAGSGAVFGCGSVPLSISEELSVFCGEIHQLRMARIGPVVRFGLVSNSPNYSH